MKQIFMIFLIIILNIKKNELKCLQAWNGSGTGAWYRVDTICNSSFISTELINCLPTIILPLNLTEFTDGFYISLGVFNRFNGVSLDIGLTFDLEKNRWFSYGNDRLGWKSGSISIDSNENRCINVSLSIFNDYIHYIIRNSNGSIILGEDKFYSFQIDPLLNLTKNNSDSFGFYRFDSIAQSKETLKSGSQLIHAQMFNWTVKFSSGEILPANEYNIAKNISGYSPGICCSNQEIKTIEIHQQIKWNQSDISIRYI
ncbi:unnamed protein product [Adineta ricciae]|uniref:Uncharacterized protein n=1 Tax=Adineta ricciae TaxID=249248 RepID=A0A815YTJ8_ADIRI|nr:unnamed protein product [Adineta ricciae]CAF1574746.1 unnamed protein product [Adineta ricciae]